MVGKKKLTKGDKKVLDKIFGGDQNMVIKIDKKENQVTIITPLVRIRKRGCKSIVLKEGSKDQELPEEETDEDT